MESGLRRLTPRAIALVCGGLAAFVALFTQWASRRPHFHPSLLLNVADTDQIAPLIRDTDPSFQFVSASDHYDGIYFYAMARDPFALGPAHDLIDMAAYRYGHPLYSWVAGILSFGQVGLLPWVFWFLSLASMAAAAIMVSLLVHRLGGSAWWGLVVAASPGMLFSASTALTEPAQVALVCAVVLVWLREKPNPWLLGGLLVATCLTKEQLVLVPIALLVDLAIKVAKGQAVGWGRLGALAAGPLALGVWLVYVRGQFTAEQLKYDAGNVGMPFLGWFETFDMAGGMRSAGFFESQIGSTATPGLIATGVVMAAAAVVGLLRRDALGWVVVLQAGLVACLGWRTTLYPHEMFRIPAVALVLAMALLAVGPLRRPAGPDTITSPAEPVSVPTPPSSPTEKPAAEKAVAQVPPGTPSPKVEGYQGRHARKSPPQDPAE